MQTSTAARITNASPARPLLDNDRYFDANPSVRAAARTIYEATRDLPLVCPHGHVDPAILAENRPFPEPATLFIKPDHYIFRMLYSRGIPMEAVGIPTKDGAAGETDPRRVWQIFADNYYLFRGTPTGAWLDYELAVVFGVDEKLRPDNAQRIYDELNEKLGSPEFLPRALFERFNIEVLATTDRESDLLEHHTAIASSGWPGKVIPTFRPDAVLRIASPTWRADHATLERAHGNPIRTFESFVAALEERRAYFKAHGAKATDHAVAEPYTERLSPAACEALFAKALEGSAAAADQRAFEGHMLIEMARMSVEDGLVMQLHS